MLEIVVKEDGIRLFYLGPNAPKPLQGKGFETTQQRTNVRPVCEMVGIHRLELWTSAV